MIQGMDGGRRRGMDVSLMSCPLSLLLNIMYPIIPSYDMDMDTTKVPAPWMEGMNPSLWMQANEVYHVWMEECSLP